MVDKLANDDQNDGENATRILPLLSESAVQIYLSEGLKRIISLFIVCIDHASDRVAGTWRSLTILTSAPVDEMIILLETKIASSQHHPHRSIESGYQRSSHHFRPPSIDSQKLDFRRIQRVGIEVAADPDSLVGCNHDASYPSFSPQINAFLAHDRDRSKACLSSRNRGQSGKVIGSSIYQLSCAHTAW